MRKAFLLRIDPALWAELEVWAREESRSVNGQIEFVLKTAAALRRGGSKPRVIPAPEVQPEPFSEPASTAFPTSLL